MVKKNLIFGVIFVLVIAGLVFVFAALGAPTDLIFEQNTTVNYDKEGNFTINWSEVTNADNYTVFIYVGGVMFTSVKNSSTSSYTFSNSTDANYTFTIQAENSTAGQERNSTNISMVVDTTNPGIVYNPTTETDNGGANRTWIFVNITVTETNNNTATFYLYNSTSLVHSNSSNYNLSAPITINWTGLPNDEVYYFNVTVNDSATNEETSSVRTFYLDGTVPTSVTLTKSSSTKTSLTLTIATDDALSGIASSCTSDRSGASISGTGTSQTLTETGLGCGTSYSYIVTCSDKAGNSKASSSTSFSTNACSSGGTPPTYEWSLQKSHSWSKITSGAVAIMKDFDKEIGLKQIQIEVNSEAQDVKITVTKYDGKPANVSVEKSGKTYKYLHINAENLEGKLERAVIRMQVEKAWMVANDFEIDNIVMFKFNEGSNKWDGLDTAYVEADDDYYYYDAEVDSFSYFAISEKVVVDDGIGEEGEDGVEKKGLGWWWVVIIAGVIIIAYLISAKVFKKR